MDEKKTLEEMLEEMEGNVFHEHRKEIAAISDETGEDVGISCEYLIQRHNWDYDAMEDQKRAFLSYVNELQRATSKSHNYVAEYFGVEA